MKKSFFLYIYRLGCNLTITIDGITSQPCIDKYFQFQDEKISTCGLYLDFFPSLALVRKLRRGKGKEVSYLKRNISANTEISNEIKRLSFVHLCSTPWKNEFQTNIFLCPSGVLTLLIVIYTVNKCFSCLSGIVRKKTGP